uniref:Uncharacterized protein n=1 Tax=Sphaerodactylus townsendi TaxID=933632 RepID=A0ACB8FJL9_9SAUR
MLITHVQHMYPNASCILEEDVLGSLGVQLAVSVADPEESIQEKAREGMSQLLTMLLHRWGSELETPFHWSQAPPWGPSSPPPLRGKRRCLPWAHDPEQPWRMSCIYLLTIGEENYLKGDVASLLYDLQMGRQVPKDIQALVQRTVIHFFQLVVEHPVGQLSKAKFFSKLDANGTEVVLCRMEDIGITGLDYGTASHKTLTSLEADVPQTLHCGHGREEGWAHRQ